MGNLQTRLARLFGSHRWLLKSATVIDEQTRKRTVFWNDTWVMNQLVTLSPKHQARSHEIHLNVPSSDSRQQEGHQSVPPLDSKQAEQACANRWQPTRLATVGRKVVPVEPATLDWK